MMSASEILRSLFHAKIERMDYVCTIYRLPASGVEVELHRIRETWKLPDGTIGEGGEALFQKLHPIEEAAKEQAEQARKDAAANEYKRWNRRFETLARQIVEDGDDTAEGLEASVNARAESWTSFPTIELIVDGHMDGNASFDAETGKLTGGRIGQHLITGLPTFKRAVARWYGFNFSGK